MRDTSRNGISTQKVVNASASARPRADIAETVGKAVKTLLGTEVPDDAPLMGAGLDSIAAVDLVLTLGQQLGTEIEPTALFDYPTIGSLSKHLTADMEPVDITVAPPLAQTSTKPRSKVDVASVVQTTVDELLGTMVPNDAPLMGAGLDSIAAVDLVSTLSQRLGTELEPTALFDYPTIGSLTKYLDEQMEPEIEIAQEGNVVPITSQLEAGDKAMQECFVVATAMYLPTVEGSFTNGDLQGLSHGRFETPTHVPATRWNMDSIDTRRFSADARSRVRYGSFL